MVLYLRASRGPWKNGGQALGYSTGTDESIFPPCPASEVGIEDLRARNRSAGGTVRRFETLQRTPEKPRSVKEIVRQIQVKNSLAGVSRMVNSMHREKTRELGRTAELVVNPVGYTEKRRGRAETAL